MTKPTGPLSRPCPRCHQPAGKPCRIASGKTRPPHAARRAPDSRRALRAHPDGAPLQLTPETSDLICGALRVGTPLHLAAQAAGIHRATLHTWLARADSDAPEDAVFREFRDAALRARGMGAVRHVRQIDKAAQGRLVSEEPVFTPDGKAVLGPDGKPLYKRRYEMDWRASAFLLERGWPLEFGRREVVELQAGDAAELGGGATAAPAGGLAGEGIGRIVSNLGQFRARKELEAAETGGDGGPITDAEVVDEG